MKQNPKRIAVVLASIALLAGIAYWYKATGGCCANPIQDRVVRDHLLQLWNEGRVTLLLRHTEKCPSDATSACPPGSALTRRGQADAKIIGHGIANLLKQPFTLYSSKAERTRQTAQQLGFDQTVHIAPWLRENCKSDLQTQLEQPPHGNRVLVTHSTCMGILHDRYGNNLLGFSPAGHEDYGLAVFLAHPEAGGTPKVIGCLWPDDWAALHDED